MHRIVAAVALLATVLTALLTACAAGPPPQAPTVVDTTSGELHGTVTDTARTFLGIRYAQPAERWIDPVPVEKAAGPVDATTPGPSCAQAGTAPGAEATASASEDCLFLNVTTPRDAGADLPVMVWWHGGGYTSGSGAAYDAQRFADRGNVVVVTVNYRLGVFGYFGLPGLAGSGDFGLADQIMATRWAEDNAAAFGGDPDNITVFGESAGAMSACALLGSPAIDGLVDKVAMSSGSCLLSWPQGGLFPGLPPTTPYVSAADLDGFGQAEAATLGCTGPGTLDCLRAKPTADLMPIFGDFANTLAYDTPLLPMDPAQAVREGRVARVPVLSGGNRDESDALIGGAVQAMPGAITAENYGQVLAAAYGPSAPDVQAAYPPSDYASPAAAFAAAVTDGSWACPTLTGNALLAGHGLTVHGYEFADPTAPNVNGVTTPAVPQGAAHATDVPYLFDLTGRNLLTSPEQRRLADRMIDYWTSFARTGTPTAAGAPEWPPLTGPGGPSLLLGPEPALVDLGVEHRCGLWSQVSSAG